MCMVLLQDSHEGLMTQLQICCAFDNYLTAPFIVIVKTNLWA